MKENKKNEGLQSRREFFKKAAKSALPILGAVALMSAPSVANAMQKTVMDCNASCSSSCTSACKGSCSGNCSGTCTGSCKNSCMSTSARG